jgi:hypothetical protein
MTKQNLKAPELTEATFNELLEAHVDVTGAAHVHILADYGKKVLHLNVNGVCLTRVCRIQELVVEEIGGPKLNEPQPESDEVKLRRLLCQTYAGSMAYTDDGEAQDSREHPCIDFLRDSVEAIQEKMQQRAATLIKKDFDVATLEATFTADSVGKAVRAPDGWWTQELERIWVAPTDEPFALTVDTKRAAFVALRVARGDIWDDTLGEWKRYDPSSEIETSAPSKKEALGLVLVRKDGSRSHWGSLLFSIEISPEESGMKKVRNEADNRYPAHAPHRWAIAVIDTDLR